MNTSTEPSQLKAWKVRYVLDEPLFYASRELGTLYITEPFLSSYAQPYALGWVHGAYRLVGDGIQRPLYKEHLAPLNERSVYLTPAMPEGPVLMKTERFNAMSESYWYGMAQGRVASELVHRFGKTARAVNMPQQGVIRFIARGQRFTSYLLATSLPQMPSFCRFGKFMSKTRVTFERMPELEQGEGEYDASGLLNPADLPDGTAPVFFDRLNVRPVPLLSRARLRGSFWKMGRVCLPRGMRYNF